MALQVLLSAYILFTLLISTNAQNSSCGYVTACIDLFDTLVICGVPIPSNTSAPESVLDTGSHKECLCKTRGFVRTAVDCLECNGLNSTGYGYWCVDEPSKEFPRGAIIGIVIAVVAVIAMGVWYALYRRSKNRKRATGTEEQVNLQNGMKMELEENSRREPLSRRSTEVGELEGREIISELPGH